MSETRISINGPGVVHVTFEEEAAVTQMTVTASEGEWAELEFKSEREAWLFGQMLEGLARLSRPDKLSQYVTGYFRPKWVSMPLTKADLSIILEPVFGEVEWKPKI